MRVHKTEDTVQNLNPDLQNLSSDKDEDTMQNPDPDFKNLNLDKIEDTVQYLNPDRQNPNPDKLRTPFRSWLPAQNVLTIITSSMVIWRKNKPQNQGYKQEMNRILAARVQVDKIEDTVQNQLWKVADGMVSAQLCSAI